MNRNLKRAPFARALSAAGFKRDGRSTDPLLYVLTVGDRELDVQLWSDGGHRVSHSVISELPGRPARAPFLGKTMTTTPTDFRTVPQMFAAILRELSRDDHKPDGWAYARGWGAATVLARERRRQVDDEGWTAEHDDKHCYGQLALAAAAYSAEAAANFASAAWLRTAIRSLWPWGANWWKPRNPALNLVRAGALIIAELERLDRLPCVRGAAVAAPELPLAAPLRALPPVLIGGPEAAADGREVGA